MCSGGSGDDILCREDGCGHVCVFSLPRAVFTGEWLPERNVAWCVSEHTS